MDSRRQLNKTTRLHLSPPRRVFQSVSPIVFAGDLHFDRSLRPSGSFGEPLRPAAMDERPLCFASAATPGRPSFYEPISLLSLPTNSWIGCRALSTRWPLFIRLPAPLPGASCLFLCALFLIGQCIYDFLLPFAMAARCCSIRFYFSFRPLIFYIPFLSWQTPDHYFDHWPFLSVVSFFLFSFA